jgi:hypothetical protein
MFLRRRDKRVVFFVVVGAEVRVGRFASFGADAFVFRNSETRTLVDSNFSDRKGTAGQAS